MDQFESLYRALVDAAEDHIFVIDANDRVEFVNHAAARQLRARPEDIIGRRRADVFPADVGERQARALRKVFETGEPLYAEGRTVYLERDVWLSTWLAPVMDGHGGVRAVLGLSRDLTANKQVENALRESEQSKSVILSNIPLILWAVDANGMGTFCSGLALEALGGSPGDVIGRHFNSIELAPFPALREHAARALAGELVNARVDAGPSTFDAWMVPLRDSSNQIVGATGVIVDVSDRRRLETELSNSQKMEAIGRLAGGIAHDFNNNLTAILGFLDLARYDLGGDSPVIEHLDEARHAAERAAGLVRRLLAFGKRQVLQPRRISLNTAIEGLMPMLERLIGTSLEIRKTMAPDLPEVMGDPSELEQIVMNLALNARDAMPDGGTLTIDTERVRVSGSTHAGMPPGQYVVLTVTDTGAGMSPEVKERAFEPFFTTKSMDRGTGLGLSTVYGIVKQLQGFIFVDSELGRGSTFRVYLPPANVAEAGDVDLPAAPVRNDARRQTVLLVEDEHPVRRFVKFALEHNGFTVIEAGSPDEALALIGPEAPEVSVLLTDVVMPGMSGPELAKRLKAVRPDLRVLFMSGYPSALVQHNFNDLEMRLLKKPFTTAELMASISAVVAH